MWCWVISPFRDPSLRRFHLVPGCDGRTDGQTDGHPDRSVRIALLTPCKNVVKMFYFTCNHLLSSTRMFNMLNHFQNICNKKVLSQGNRAMPQLFFSVLTSPTTFTTSVGVAKLRRPGFRAPNTPAQKHRI